MAGNTFIERIKIQLDGAGKAAKGANKVSKGMTKLATAAAGAAAAYFGAGMLIEGIKKSTEAFAAQELAQRRLMQSTGDSAAALQLHAAALQANSIHGDEAIMAQQAFLGSIGMTEAQIKQILPVAMDLAAATGMTLESAVRNTAKTFSGLAGELGELVPQLRDLTAEEMKAGKAVEVMSALFAGQAEIAATTYDGAMKQIDNRIGDLSENIGQVLAPAIAKAKTDLANFIEHFLELFGLMPDINDFVKEHTHLLRMEHAQFNANIHLIKNHNIDAKTREGLIEQINAKYKEYLPFLLTEETSLEDIGKAQREVNKALRDSINLKIQEVQTQFYEAEAGKKLNEGLEARQRLHEMILLLQERGYRAPSGLHTEMDLMEMNVQRIRSMAKILAFEFEADLTDADLYKFMTGGVRELPFGIGKIFQNIEESLGIMSIDEAIDLAAAKMDEADEMVVVFLEKAEKARLEFERQRKAANKDKDPDDPDDPKPEKTFDEKYKALEEELLAKAELKKEELKLEKQFIEQQQASAKILGMYKEEEIETQDEWNKKKLEQFDLLEKEKKWTDEFIAANEEKAKALGMVQEEELEGQALFQKQQDDAYTAAVNLQTWTDEYIEANAEKAESLGLLTSAQIAETEAKERDRKVEAERVEGIQKEIDVLNLKNETVSSTLTAGEKLLSLNHKNAKTIGKIQTARALVDAYFAAQVSFKQAQQNPLSVANPAYPYAIAAATLTKGLANAAAIRSRVAAKGMDEVVTEPTLILAGEAGAEYVDIEPLTNEGEGRKGGINITFTGNVMSDSFIENEAIPKIKEAIRKGGDIGIS